MEGKYSVSSNSACRGISKAHIWDYAKEVEFDDGTYSEIVCINCSEIDRVRLS